MKRIYLLILVVSILSSTIHAQITTQNYIRTRTMLNDTGTKYLDEIQYYDGLGRPFQTVQKGITPTEKNLISLQVYDYQGRESGVWFPVPVTEDYLNKIFHLAGSLNFYGDFAVYGIEYEESPLNRITMQGGPGMEWIEHGRGITTEYETNTTSGILSCKRYTTSTTTVTPNGVRPAGTLHVVKQMDEDNHVNYVFTDQLGQTVLERRVIGDETFDTYYLYSNGRLLYVLQPMFQVDPDLGKYAYQYKYDNRNRCTEKKLPGCEPVTYRYDWADRLIFSQDGNQRAASPELWNFYLYDSFGREVIQGTCSKTSAIDRVFVTTSFSPSGGGINGSGYSTNITLTDPVVGRISYYDNYGFLSLSEFTNRNNFPLATVRATGQLTGLVHILPGTSTRLCETFYYDVKGQLLNHVADNHLGGVDKTLTTYTFTGLPVTVTKTHSAPGKSTQTEVYTHTYDHAERLTKLTHKLNSNATVTLAEHTYDELGRLKTKTNHSSAVNTATYAYNIRDWVTEINGSKFSQNLYYNTGPGTPLYNGNISAMTWKAGAETTTRGYKFTYDPVDRLTVATYGEGTAISANPNRFDEKVSQYDKNGNIKKLERRGKTSTTAYGVIDNLTFTHTGNQLQNVSDAATDPTYAGNFNFVDGNKGTGTEYVWDKNGNMVQDYNKQIAHISYNSLNLPFKLQFRYGHTAEYLYDASGVKRQVKHTTINQNLSVGWGSFKAITAAQKASEKVTDYCGNVIYENGALKMILTPEGYITLSGTTPTYYYYLRDHLGNNRVVVSQSGTVEQVNHYYPFGGLFGEGTATTDQPYKYNDKELDRTNGLDLYDYSARFMDAAVGRFTTIDPHTESYRSYSPYAYAFNNPVSYTDPTGMDPVKEGGTLPEVEIFAKRLVAPPVAGNWNTFLYYFSGRTHTETVKLINFDTGTERDYRVTYNVNKEGEITGFATIGGDAPLPSTTGFSFTKLLKYGKQIWSSTRNVSSLKNALNHWLKHAKEFPEYKNAKEYINGTNNFLHNSPSGTMVKIRSNGDILKYHPPTNTFGVMDAQGTPKTMFRPMDGMNYWLNQ